MDAQAKNKEPECVGPQCDIREQAKHGHWNIQLLILIQTEEKKSSPPVYFFVEMFDKIKAFLKPDKSKKKLTLLQYASQMSWKINWTYELFKVYSWVHNQKHLWNN